MIDIEIKMSNQRVEQLRLQRLGEDWIQAIATGQPERLEQFCTPEVVSRLLTPRKFMTLDNTADLVTKYREWFGECTDLQLEESRVGQVGERLGISYRFRLRDHGDWNAIEQQLYCTVKDGRVEKLNLLCSGFQLIGISDDAVAVDASSMEGPGMMRDALLEFHSELTDTISTCALLTPTIKTKLREMQSGQVLEVSVDDPNARGDIEAWCRLSGNTLLTMIEEGSLLRFFVKKK